MTRLLRVEEAATLLGLQPVTVRRMIREGRLPLVRPTGFRAVRVREDDVEALTRVRASRRIETKRERGDAV